MTTNKASEIIREALIASLSKLLHNNSIKIKETKNSIKGKYNLETLIKERTRQFKRIAYSDKYLRNLFDALSPYLNESIPRKNLIHTDLISDTDIAESINKIAVYVTGTETNKNYKEENRDRTTVNYSLMMAIPNCDTLSDCLSINPSDYQNDYVKRGIKLEGDLLQCYKESVIIYEKLKQLKEEQKNIINEIEKYSSENINEAIISLTSKEEKVEEFKKLIDFLLD